MTKIYHNPRCAKSRETLQLLRDNKIEPVIVEYLVDIPTATELKTILKKLRLPAEALLRKKEGIFIEKFKGKSLTEDGWISAMVKYPKLIERPIVINGNKAAIGRPPEKVLEIF